VCRESCVFYNRTIGVPASNERSVRAPRALIGNRGVAHGGCATAHARSHPQIGELCNHRVAYSSIFLRLPRGAGSICGKFGAFLSTGVEW
jgi:CxxC motif-containing protein (DUF1111 family)